MIASLRGTVQSASLNSVVLDVSGVGYLVSITPALALGVKVGEELFLHTAFIVREDAFTIFGFSDFAELETFDLLRSVTGVGPKSALSIVNQLSLEALHSAVANEDDSAFRSVSGIGPKTAKLIVVTLAGKLKVSSGASGSTDSQIVSALVGLGYQLKIAEQAVKVARKSNAEAGSEELLKISLRSLAAR